MQSPTCIQDVLTTYELLERILLHLDSIRDITLVQRVSRRWRAVIQDSPALQRARWYRPHVDKDLDNDDDPDPAPSKYRLNPVFNSLGVTLGSSIAWDLWKLTSGEGDGADFVREHGDFDLTERVYDRPGSWATMLATQPPCRRIEVVFSSESAGDRIGYRRSLIQHAPHRRYIVESTTASLHMGEVMAALAECQNRQEMGVDSWVSVRHPGGRLYPVGTTQGPWGRVLQAMANDDSDVSIKVAVEKPFGAGEYPAFSLRRVHPPPAPAGGEFDHPHEPASYMELLYELVVYKRVWEFWEDCDERSDGVIRPEWNVCKTGEYRANLLAVRSHEGEYLARCSHIFRLLPDVRKERLEIPDKI